MNENVITQEITQLQGTTALHSQIFLWQHWFFSYRSTKCTTWNMGYMLESVQSMSNLEHRETWFAIRDGGHEKEWRHETESNRKHTLKASLQRKHLCKLFLLLSIHLNNSILAHSGVACSSAFFLPGNKSSQFNSPTVGEIESDAGLDVSSKAQIS